MVARLTPPPVPVKLTQENHPENAAEPAEPLPTVSLFSMVAIGALCGVTGMAFGTAALSSAIAFGGPLHVLSLIPLVVGLVAFLTGWVGAFFWMCREHSTHQQR